MNNEKALLAVTSVALAFAGIIITTVQESRIRKLKADVRNKDAIARVNKRAFTRTVAILHPEQIRTALEDLAEQRKFESIVKDF